MNLGQRIEERRKEVGISQAELARRVGVRQSTMNSLITGNSRTSRALVQIARELRTTPEWLTGESTDPNVSSGAEVGLNSEERELLDNFRAIEARDRKAISQLARSIASNAGGHTLHDRPTEFRGK